MTPPEIAALLFLILEVAVFLFPNSVKINDKPIANPFLRIVVAPFMLAFLIPIVIVWIPMVGCGMVYLWWSGEPINITRHGKVIHVLQRKRKF